MLSFLQRYPYTVGFIVSILIAVWLYISDVFDLIVTNLDGGGYVTALLAGFLFPITFTAASAGLYLVELGEHLHPIMVALLGGFGAMLTDLLMYRFIKGTLIQELKAIGIALIPAHRREGMERFSKRRVFLWGVPFIASLLIASPFPDEIGVALYGLVNFRPKYLSVITYLLNTIGIFFLAFLGRALAS